MSMKLYRSQALIRPDLQAYLFGGAAEQCGPSEVIVPARREVLCGGETNAYGHGISEVVTILKDAEVDFFAVASFYEAIHIAEMVGGSRF